MNARDGMRRLRAERKEYGLCMICGKKLGSETKYVTCDACRDFQRKYRRGHKDKRMKREGVI